MVKVGQLPPTNLVTNDDYVIIRDSTSQVEQRILVSDFINFIQTSTTNLYKFRVSRNAAANTGSAAYALVAFDTVQFDSNSDVSGGVYTVPVDGFYFFTGQVNVNLGGENRVVIIGLFKNGVQCSVGNESFGTSGTNSGIVVSDALQLTAGDTIDLRAYCSATKALNVGSTAQNYFAGYLISRT